MEDRERIIAEIVSMIEHAIDGSTDRVQALHSATDIFMEARARVSYKLNLQTRFSRLPTEIWLRCFELMSFGDLVRASHVCRDWRSAALNHHILWRHIDFAQLRDSIKLESFEELFARSSPMPVHVVNSSYRDDISEFILQNLGRLDYLSTHEDLESWELMKSMPLLVSLKCGSLEIPEEWGGRLAPCLRELSVKFAKLPVTFSAVPSMRSFSCADSRGADFTRLYELFPQLETISLSKIDDNTLLPDILTPRLLEIKLKTFPGSSSGLDRYIRPMYVSSGHSLRHLTLDAGTCAHKAKIILPIFSAVVNTAPWRMHVRVNRVQLISLSIPDFQVSLKGHISEIVETGAQHWPQLFSQLTTLDVDYASVVEYGMSSMLFPGVTDIALTFRDFYSYAIAAGNSSGQQFALSAMMTRRLVVDCDNLPSTMARHPDFCTPFVLSLVDFSRHKLDSITIVSRDTKGFDRCDWTAIMTRTMCISLQDPTSKNVLREIQ